MALALYVLSQGTAEDGSQQHLHLLSQDLFDREGRTYHHSPLHTDCVHRASLLSGTVDACDSRGCCHHGSRLLYTRYMGRALARIQSSPDEVMRPSRSLLCGHGNYSFFLCCVAPRCHRGRRARQHCHTYRSDFFRMLADLSTGNYMACQDVSSPKTAGISEKGILGFSRNQSLCVQEATHNSHLQKSERAFLPTPGGETLRGSEIHCYSPGIFLPTLGPWVMCLHPMARQGRRRAP